MQRQRSCSRLGGFALLCSGCLFAAQAFGAWPTFTNESNTRLSSDTSVGLFDTEEKDYDWGDVDNDGDIDLVDVRKQPFTTAGGRRNVLFLNVNGVLTDVSSSKIPGFLDATDDRDVRLVDVNNDTWLDIVTAAACNVPVNGPPTCSSGMVSTESRLYMNLGAPGGTWLGYGAPIVLFSGGHNYCGVAAGDITGDGYADLYFASYRDNAEDQLMINGGVANPGTFTIQNNRLTAAMRASDFGTAVVLADMDNDGDRDIVKTENSPLEVYRNTGSGFFDLLDPTFTLAAYHVEVGYLNGDGLLDLVISDDGVDRYVLNNGNLMNGSSDTTLAFPSTTDGFGSESVITDLDNDGWNDVLITDVDVDLGGCARVSDILRNNSGASFTSNPSNIATGLLTGVHDIAVFDINGDGLKDILIGRCNGTTVMINSPPVSVTFIYPNGLPEFVTPNQAAQFQVQITPAGGTVAPGTPAIHVSVNGGAFSNTPLTALGGTLYLAQMPAGACTDSFKFYLSAQLAGGAMFNDPAAAPAANYAAFAAAGTNQLFADTMEGAVAGWTVTNDPSLTAGHWEQAIPNSTFVPGIGIAAPGSDATASPGVKAFVTQNGPPGGGYAADDVDGGPTYLTSPVFNLSGTDGLVSYSRWAFSAFQSHDSLVVEVSNNNGASWTQVESVGSTGGQWQANSFFVSDFVVPSSQVRVRFSMADADASVTEGGVDDFSIDILTCGSPCPWDINGDGNVGITDFLALLAAWGPNPGNPADINGDGSVGIADFLDLLAHWGLCP